MIELLAILVLVALLAGTAGYCYRLLADRRRERYLQDYTFPHGLFARVRKTHPQLTEKQFHLVAQALRQYFSAYRRSGFKSVGMPSRIVDDLWHHFILSTKDYDAFCRSAFGHFFHHVPAAPIGDMQSERTLAMKRTWRACCKLEGINPNHPSRLPLLFAIDAKLAVSGAVTYSLDRRRRGATNGSGAAAPHGGGSEVCYVDSFCDQHHSASESGADGSASSGGDSCGGGCGGGD